MSLSEAFRCYTAETHATAQTIQVAAGSQLGFVTDTADGIGHPGVCLSFPSVWMWFVSDFTICYAVCQHLYGQSSRKCYHLGWFRSSLVQGSIFSAVIDANLWEFIQVHEISAVTDGGQTITWPAQSESLIWKQKHEIQQ